MGKQSGESGVWQCSEKVQKLSDYVLEMSGRVSIVHVFKGSPPATNLSRIGQPITSLAWYARSISLYASLSTTAHILFIIFSEASLKLGITMLNQV